MQPMRLKRQRSATGGGGQWSPPGQAGPRGPAARARAGGRPMDLGRDVVMGHEFCAELVEHGPGAARTLPVGARVCSRPMLIRDTGPQTIGYSNDHPGGYGEHMRLSEALLLAVPYGLPTDQAALTEPMAVGLHAVQKARLQ